MIAGGADSTVSPLGIGGFAAARALSTRNDDPAVLPGPGTAAATASCSARARVCWSRGPRARGRARGHHPCELIASSGGDAFHVTAPNVDGPKRTISQRCAMPHRSLEVDYLNAHGTRHRSRPQRVQRDQARARRRGAQLVISRQVDDRHPARRGGGIESVFTVLSLRDQVAPPTINLTIRSGVRPRLSPNVARAMISRSR